VRTSALSALPLPDDLAAAIRACDEASDAVRAARQAYTEARSAYTEASKPPAEPEAVDRAHQALRNAQHQVQVADAALRRAEKAVTEGIKAHRLELLPAAIALAEQGMAQYEEAHAEACKWEHVMSDNVELRIYHLLGRPTHSPYGNPIPGLAELDAQAPPVKGVAGERHLASPGVSGQVVISRICESIQIDSELLHRLHSAGVDPGATVTVVQENDLVTVERNGSRLQLPRNIASRVFVAP